MKAQTRITLTKIKYLRQLSEETACFYAIVNLDGKPISEVQNEGHGGANTFHPISNDGHREAEQFAAEICSGEDGLYDGALSAIVDKLLDEHLMQKTYIAALKRKLKTHVIFVRNGSLMQVKKNPQLPLADMVEICRKKFNAENILNMMSEANALKTFIDCHR